MASVWVLMSPSEAGDVTGTLRSTGSGTRLAR
jgi:hypothetical protein